MVNTQSQPAKLQKTDNGKTSSQAPQVIKTEVIVEKEQVEQVSNSPETILGMAVDETSQQESESQLEFSEVDEVIRKHISRCN